MSILLEALKQKNTRSIETNSPAQRNEPMSNSRGVESALSLQDKLPDAVASDSPEPMEALLSQLDIAPPPGLDWQLNAKPSSTLSPLENKPDTMVAEPTAEAEKPQPSLPPLTLDLILPTPAPTNSVTYVVDDRTQATEVVEDKLSFSANVKQTEKPQLGDAFSVSHQPQQPDTVYITPNEAPSSSFTSMAAEMPSEPVVDVTKIAQQPVPSTSSVDLSETTPSDGLAAESILSSISSVQVEKSPQAAQRFLAFARRMKPNLGQKSDATQAAVETVSPVLLQARSPQAQKSLLVAGGVVLAIGGLAYATLTIWESQQQEHLQQLSRYKNQSLTDLPEKPVVNPATNQPAEPLPVNTPVLVTTQEALPNQAPIAETEQAVSMVSVAKVTASSKPVKQLKVEPTDFAKPFDTTRKQPKQAALGSEVHLSQSQPTAEILLMAYQAYERGDWQASEQLYRQVLEKQPKQRDALLGMLAIYQVTQADPNRVRELAEALLTLYPKDMDVKLATQGILGSPSSLSVTQLSSTTQQQGATGAEANFRMGLALAQQQRWSEAQSAFFEAVNAKADQPEYRLNLAVSYDHLGKHRLALEHYQTALILGKNRLTDDDKQMIQQRLDFLIPLFTSEP